MWSFEVVAVKGLYALPKTWKLPSGSISKGCGDDGSKQFREVDIAVFWCTT
jgi:hypothetical protein